MQLPRAKLSIAYAMLLLTLLLLPPAAMAQSAGETPANKEYMAAMEKMNKDMMAATDQDAAKSFAKKMAAHHQGAIDMSRIVLQHAKDSEIRKIANKTIKEQEKEIKKLKGIARHGG